MARLAESGWRGVVAHFRGCGGETNRMPRAYHSGDHAEIGAILAAVRTRVEPDVPVFAFGVSLGGSALLNWVGRAGADAARTISAAAAASTPLDLMASGLAIDQGLNRLIYVQAFLRTLKPKALAMERRYPGLVDARRVAKAATLWEFDDAFTAPVHGFAGTGDYWTRASSRPWLRDVALPTLGAQREERSVRPRRFAAGRAAGERGGRARAARPWRPRGLRDFAASRRHPLDGAAGRQFLRPGTLNTIRHRGHAPACETTRRTTTITLTRP
jgi:alpha-beta hydrolase superfamily lysophospholipase